MTDLTSRPTPLNRELLASRHPRVAVPRYDRARLAPAVVHLGVGAFHRAHQAVYFDELAGRGHTGWGVVGVGIRRRRLGTVLRAQDHLFLVVQRGTEASSARVVGSLVDFLLLADAPRAVAAQLADPRTRLVTLTITGDGYRVDDLDAPRSPVFDALVSALDARRRAGQRPFTVLSCDNLADSGDAARRATLAVARARSAELADWIAAEVRFPASMVDRITPSTSQETRAEITAEFGVDDACPVVSEAFAQWVIEDDFTQGRPPLDAVGAQFVTDVAPYKLIKSRLLNGTHSALGYVAALCGHATTADAMADPLVARYVERLMAEEISPALPQGVPGMELDGYRGILLDRFASPAVADPLTRLCRRGSTKMADYLLPSLHDAVAAGRPRRLLVLALAAWRQHLTGRDLLGTPIEVDDARLDRLQPLARESAAALLGVPELFGDLSRDRHLVDEVERTGDRLRRDGMQATLRTVLEVGP